MPTQPMIEELSEEIHKLYCVQYEKDHGEPYWTHGDYSKLEERVKEYDRNIAKFVIEREKEAYTKGTQDTLTQIGKRIIWSRSEEDMKKTALGIMQYFEERPLKESLSVNK